LSIGGIKLTLKAWLSRLREKHWSIVESSGSLGIFGIVALFVAAVLLFFIPFLGATLSKVVAFILCGLVPVFNL